MPYARLSFENAISLISDADLLYTVMVVLSLCVLRCHPRNRGDVQNPGTHCLSRRTRQGTQPNWDDIAEFLTSHYGKLMMNELWIFATQRSATGLDATGQQAMAGSG